MKSKAYDPFEYINRSYGVPASPGMRVIADGNPGKIINASGAHLLVRWDSIEATGKKVNFFYHPTWHMIYLDGDGNEIWRDPEYAEKGKDIPENDEDTSAGVSRAAGDDDDARAGFVR